VLVAIRPLLLADLVRSALPADYDVVVQPRSRRSRDRWDVVVVSHGSTTDVDADHVVVFPSATESRDFRSLVAAVIRLCEVRPTA
jgi:hypothetical protein